MITLTDSIEIKTTPEKIFNWFVHFVENFKAWHPDHVECHWLKGDQFEEGSILYVEEYLHGKSHKMKILCTKVEPYKKIEYKLLFPTSIIFPKGSFIIESKGKSCIFTAALSFRFGKILSKLVKSRVVATKKHMREEGKNLKKLVEQG